MIKNILPFLLIFLLFSTCVEPYQVDTEGYRDLLVVDALITNENKTHLVSLTRSTPNINQKAVKVTGAIVEIRDDLGNVQWLTEKWNGIYVTDSTRFIPQVGRTYKLFIKTTDGKEYQSTACKMLPQTEISRIYFKKDKQWDNNNINENEGIGIFLDGKSPEGAYIRWTFQEDWKFRITFPISYKFISDKQVEWMTPVNVECWKKNNSVNISIHSFSDQMNPEIKEKQILFIPTEHTDRLTIRYSVLVKQMTISQEDYDFLKKLQSSTEDVGDIFGKQPYTINGNIANINDNKEPVLGYFQVASVASQRLYINASETFGLDLPYYKSGIECDLDTFWVGLEFKTAYDIYKKKVVPGNYAIFEPIYDLKLTTVIGLVLSNAICADCTLTGSNKKPQFWED